MFFATIKFSKYFMTVDMILLFFTKLSTHVLSIFLIQVQYKLTSIKNKYTKDKMEVKQS